MSGPLVQNLELEIDAVVINLMFIESQLIMNQIYVFGGFCFRCQFSFIFHLLVFHKHKITRDACLGV